MKAGYSGRAGRITLRWAETRRSICGTVAAMGAGIPCPVVAGQATALVSVDCISFVDRFGLSAAIEDTSGYVATVASDRLER